MPCIFQQFGCTVVRKKENMKAHETACHYRTISCLHFKCKEVSPISSYLDHLKEKHNSKAVKICDTNEVKWASNFNKYFHDLNLKGRGIAQKIVCLVQNGYHFIIDMQISFTGSTKFYTKILACGDESEKYRACIRILSRTKVRLIAFF